MKQLFEGKITYKEEGADKESTYSYLIDALTFTEAETNLTKYMVDWMDIKDFYVKSLTHKSYEDLVYLHEQDDYEWFEAKVKMKVDGDKWISFSYLVADETTKRATIQLLDYLSDSDGEVKITSIKEKPLADIIIRKNWSDSDIGNPDNIVILSFEEQKDIDFKLSEMEDRNNTIMKALGAISLSFRKYTIKVNSKNLELAKGKRLGSRVLRTWNEEFIDEDTEEVVTIERNEVLLERGGIIDDEMIETILGSSSKEIKVFRD